MNVISPQNSPNPLVKERRHVAIHPRTDEIYLHIEVITVALTPKGPTFVPKPIFIGCSIALPTISLGSYPLVMIVEDVR
tara:strand:+ start:530 stop:766 length:237 start_codon:yes stop_codon:yes gene_type:complete